MRRLGDLTPIWRAEGAAGNASAHGRLRAADASNTLLLMVDVEPVRFFRPPYVGHRGWLGVRLDARDNDWVELAAIAEEAYRCVAPRTLIRQLEQR